MLLKDFNAYQDFAIKTMKKDDFLKTVLHCSMGMCGEAGELLELPMDSREERIGELGDCMWYLANLYEVLHLKLEDQVAYVEGKPFVINNTYTLPYIRLVIFSCRILDYVKKSVFYEKPIENKLITEMANAYTSALLQVCRDEDIDPLYAATVNNSKLRKRYPDLEFNAEHAINRDYAAESKAAGCKIS